MRCATYSPISLPLALLSLAMLARPLAAADATTPEAFSTPHPTTCGISLVWPFRGDANGDGRVTVRYRPQGGDWVTGMPLFRVPAGSNTYGVWGSRHLGSLFDLQPATTYDIELTLTDADGGGCIMTSSATTRAVPAAALNALVRPATPATFAAVAAQIQPGEIMALAAGTYAGFIWEHDGTATQPITIRGVPGTVIDGMIELYGRHDVILEKVVVNGRVRLNNSQRMAVMRCTVNSVLSRGGGNGIVSFNRSEDLYIADNTVIGLTPWIESSLGTNGANDGEGIVVNGPGHVIRNNRVRGMRDGLSLMEGDQAFDQYSIDICENDVSECSDDGIEVDSTLHNVRVLRNRLTNCFMGISSQPGMGGPLYVVRNALYNIVFEAFKLHNGTYGDVLLHNTVVKSGDAFSVFSGATISRTFSRNNLLIGGPGRTWAGYATGSGQVMDLYDLDVATADLDYDGYGSTAASFSGKFGPSIPFSGLAEMRSLTTEKHASVVDLGVFATPPTFPAAAMTAFAPPDLRLAAGGAAIDAGVVISGITDGFTGAAPDLGAYEAGQALPAYGVRSLDANDHMPPVLSGLTANAVSAASATFSWTTNEDATSRIEYGSTGTYGNQSNLVTLLSLHHNLTLTGLTPGSMLHWRALSMDTAGNTGASTDQILVMPPSVTAGTADGGNSAGSENGSGSDGGSDGKNGGGGCGLGAMLALLAGSAAVGLHRRRHA